LTYAEIEAFTRLRRIDIEPWEVDALIDMDEINLVEHARAYAANKPKE
jgi:hypothetical protein